MRREPKAYLWESQVPALRNCVDEVLDAYGTADA